MRCMLRLQGLCRLLRARLILSEFLRSLPASRGYYANITYVSESTYMQVEEGT